MIKIKIGEIEVSCDNSREAVEMIKSYKSPRVEISGEVYPKPRRKKGYRKVIWTREEIEHLLRNKAIKPRYLATQPELRRHTYGGIQAMKSAINTGRVRSSAMSGWIKDYETINGSFRSF